MVRMKIRVYSKIVILSFLLSISYVSISDAEKAKENVKLEVATKKLPEDSIVARIDSLAANLTKITTELENLRESQSAMLEKELTRQNEQINSLLSNAMSISSSNVGNTLGFLSLLVAIITIILALLGGAGYFILRQFLNGLQRKYEDKFREKSNEFELVIEESRANFYLTKGQNGSAKDVFEKILTIDPEYYSAHEKLGFLYLGDILGKPDKAVIHNRKAIEIRPNNLFPYINMQIAVDHDINMQIAVDHAHYPFEENEKAFNNALEMCGILNADEMTIGKVKLFFADKVRVLRPDDPERARELYQEAIQYLEKVQDRERQSAKETWLTQARNGLEAL